MDQMCARPPTLPIRQPSVNTNANNAGNPGNASSPQISIDNQAFGTRGKRALSNNNLQNMIKRRDVLVSDDMDTLSNVASKHGIVDDLDFNASEFICRHHEMFARVASFHNSIADNEYTRHPDEETIAELLESMPFRSVSDIQRSMYMCINQHYIPRLEKLKDLESRLLEIRDALIKQHHEKKASLERKLNLLQGVMEETNRQLQL